MNDAKKASKEMANARRRKVRRAARELEHLRARDLKGKPRLYPAKEPDRHAR